jgi:hypothetical protein
MKTYGEVELEIELLPTSALDRDRLSVSRTGYFNPDNKTAVRTGQKPESA